MKSSRKSSLWSEKPQNEHELSHPTRAFAPSSDVFDVHVLYQSCIDQFCVLLELDSRDTILREYQTLLLWGQECRKQLDTAFQISQRVGNIVSRLLQSISKTLRGALTHTTKTMCSDHSLQNKFSCASHMMIRILRVPAAPKFQASLATMTILTKKSMILQDMGRTRI